MTFNNILADEVSMPMADWQAHIEKMPARKLRSVELELEQMFDEAVVSPSGVKRLWSLIALTRIAMIGIEFDRRLTILTRQYGRPA